MNEPDPELEYLQRSGFTRQQAEAILAARSMAARGYPEQTIRLTLMKRGFFADQAETITKAALKANPSPRQRPSDVSAGAAYAPGQSGPSGGRLLRVFIWIVVVALIRWLLFLSRH